MPDAPDPDDPETLQPVGQYDPPAMPTDDFLRGLLNRAKHFLSKSDDAPFLADARLRGVPKDLAGPAHVPPCGPVLRAMHASLGDWVADAGAAARVKVVVLPPCDPADTLGAYADRHGLEVLPPPRRATLLAGGPAGEMDLGGERESVLVVPDLARWFLRHRSGLASVRALLAALGATERRCLVGCNSWAWAFLTAACDAKMIVPKGLTFAPFDGPRLRRWFHELDDAGEGEPFDVRLASSGSTLLPGGSADDQSGYFKRLAAQSDGIPWVARQMWRDSLRTKAPDEKGAEAGGSGGPGVDAAASDGGTVERRTLWVSALQEFTVPNRHEPDELLVLAALLVHGPLDAEELHAVVPAMREANIVQALRGAGLLEDARDARHDSLRVRPAAYPAVRAGLSAAGFPMDEL